MRTLPTIFIPLVACLITACASSEAPVSKTRLWLGANKQTLLDEWGKPTTIKELPDGSAIYQFVRQRARATLSPAPQRGVMIVGSHQAIGFSVAGNTTQQAVSYCYTDFEITPDGKIKSVEQKGEGCI